MPNYCQVTLAGHLTRDPELRHTQGGHAVCDIGVAVNNKKSKQEDVSFIDVTLWRSSAEAVNEYLGKGDPILVYGRLKQDRWKDDDGFNHSKVKVVAEGFEFLGGGDGGGQSQRGQQAQPDKPQAQQGDVSDDEIPF